MVLANKFLHDRVYSNKAWGKVSGLEVHLPYHSSPLVSVWGLTLVRVGC